MAKANVISIIKMSTAKIRYMAFGEMRQHRQCHVRLPKDVSSNFADGQKFFLELTDDLVIQLTPVENLRSKKDRRRTEEDNGK